MNAVVDIDGPSSFARVRVGRVVEVRAHRLWSSADITKLKAQVFAAMRGAAPEAVICADYRNASALSREAADTWSQAMRASNPMLTRSAILVNPTNTILKLQIERILLCAGDRNRRRLFSSVAELRDWVAPVLTRSEREAAGAFLSCPPSTNSGG
jgi:hypothetical protein